MNTFVKTILWLYTVNSVYGFFAVIKRDYEKGNYRYPCLTVILYLLVTFAIVYAAIML